MIDCVSISGSPCIYGAFSCIGGLLMKTFLRHALDTGFTIDFSSSKLESSSGIVDIDVSSCFLFLLQLIISCSFYWFR